MFNKNKTIEEKDERIKKALGIAWSYGQINGDNHKAWVIDQMVRALCGNEKDYRRWIAAYEAPLSNNAYDYYEWDTGIAP